MSSRAISNDNYVFSIPVPSYITDEQYVSPFVENIFFNTNIEFDNNVDYLDFGSSTSNYVNSYYGSGVNDYWYDSRIYYVFSNDEFDKNLAIVKKSFNTDDDHYYDYYEYLVISVLPNGVDRLIYYDSTNGGWKLNNLPTINFDDVNYYGLNVNSRNDRTRSLKNVGFANENFENYFSIVPFLNFSTLKDYTDYLINYGYNQGYQSAVDSYSIGQLFNIENIKNIVLKYTATNVINTNGDKSRIVYNPITDGISIDFKPMLSYPITSSGYPDVTYQVDVTFNLYTKLNFSSIRDVAFRSMSLTVVLEDGTNVLIGDNNTYNNVAYTFINFPQYYDTYVTAVKLHFYDFSLDSVVGLFEQYFNSNDVAYDSGYEQGKIDGYNQGLIISNGKLEETFNNGYTSGFDYGYQQGNTNGFNQGINDAANNELNYNNGYQQGYIDGLGEESAEQYEIGYNKGFDDGYRDGVNTNPTLNFKELFWSIGGIPFETFKSIWSFEFLGIELSGFISGFFSVFILIYILKKVL